MDKKLLIDFIFPPKCMFCSEVLAAGEECFECRKKAEFYKLPQNSRNINHSCFKNLDECISFYHYKDMIRDGILYAKFKNSSAFLRDFLSYMSFDFAEFFEKHGIDEIISMPFHKSKLYQREYDLPREMAHQIAKTYNVEYNKDLVIKVKKTKNQHDLSLSERKINLRGAFAVNGDVKGKNILIVDDIVSTGYSMEEVAKTLKKSGAARVIGITFAYNKG